MLERTEQAELAQAILSAAAALAQAARHDAALRSGLLHGDDLPDLLRLWYRFSAPARAAILDRMRGALAPMLRESA